MSGTVGASMTLDELAAIVAKAGKRLTVEEAMEAIRADCGEWREIVNDDGRIDLLRYAARLHRATR